MADFFQPINHYGCWCYFDKDYVYGKGPVQDSIDADCKQMILAHRCAKMDSIKRGNECNPATISYIPYNLFSGEKDILKECTNSNENHVDNPMCAIDACVIEGTFTLK